MWELDKDVCAVCCGECLDPSQLMFPGGLVSGVLLLSAETFVYTGLLPSFLFHFLKVFQNKFSLLVLLALGLDFHLFLVILEAVA